MLLLWYNLTPAAGPPSFKKSRWFQYDLIHYSGNSILSCLRRWLKPKVRPGKPGTRRNSNADGHSVKTSFSINRKWVQRSSTELYAQTPGLTFLSRLSVAHVPHPDHTEQPKDSSEAGVHEHSEPAWADLTWADLSSDLVSPDLWSECIFSQLTLLDITQALRQWC